ncbi:hypothetical protein HD554DRAFT_2262192 [Boletus coccyginus]|nr:hypothetical protein HD554DRAFT_2262192 [Boletus coccyginus]
MASTQQTLALFQPIKQASYYSQRGSAPCILLVTEATFISYDGRTGWPRPRGNGISSRKETGPVFTICLRMISPVTLTGRSEPPSPRLQKQQATLYTSPAPMGWRYTVHAVISWIGFFKQYSMKARIVCGGRFTREVIHAIVDAIGEDRASIRISPWWDFQGGFRCAVPKFAKMAYLHVSEPRVAGSLDITPKPDRRAALRTAEDKEGPIAFWRLHINPDLPVWLRKDLPLMPKDRPTYYLLGDLTPVDTMIGRSLTGVFKGHMKALKSYPQACRRDHEQITSSSISIIVEGMYCTLEDVYIPARRQAPRLEREQ